MPLFAALAREDPDLAHCSFARADLFVVGAPDLIHEVLVSKAARYAATSGVYKRWRRRPRFPGPPAGFLPQEGLEAHVRARRVYAPGFSRARLGAAFPLLSKIAVDGVDNWPCGREIDGCHELRLLVTRMLTTAAFGRELALPPEDIVAHVRRGPAS